MSRLFGTDGIRGVANEPPLTPRITDKTVAFSFHDYCGFSEISIYFNAAAGNLKNACDLQHNVTWNLQYDSFQRRSNMPAILTEFGGTSDPSVVARTLPRADQRFVSWQYWHYRSGQSDLFTGDLGKQLVRTYPRATAGWPVAMTYDTATGAFTYSYATRPSPEPTEIYVSDLQYPDGYRVTLTGACALSAPNARLLLLRALPGAKNVTVRLSAGNAPFPSCS